MNEALIEQLTEKHKVLLEQLTEKQLMEMLQQICTCGDILRHTNPDGSMSQAVVYVPYFSYNRLTARITELEEQIKYLEQFRPPC